MHWSREGNEGGIQIAAALARTRKFAFGNIRSANYQITDELGIGEAGASRPLELSAAANARPLFFIVAKTSEKNLGTGGRD